MRTWQLLPSTKTGRQALLSSKLSGHRQWCLCCWLTEIACLSLCECQSLAAFQVTDVSLMCRSETDPMQEPADKYRRSTGAWQLTGDNQCSKLTAGADVWFSCPPGALSELLSKWLSVNSADFAECFSAWKLTSSSLMPVCSGEREGSWAAVV